ncbi:MAG TPA: KaiC 1 [Cyanobacteria bacterium UBA11149]|nr:KaiC 1 [Cyanobacteria bacterium UBA11367]HBE57879.1 KaiC 1 [Cyanobacteria bacterium UBA11366]HBK63156.1 KaiC 1 [Cyanobacteria bacterium UBA11166]HBR74630.1 KaiC 1 [Cyanobacteria bacterium UBA11159]HBS70253.1 KaiC 1 [Cyanobacteria bacterium UBA11153]HBW91191.1 KaiC 1 [Cyanobacteria bacterium UBA11149]HCA95635.1 KaiC 1 [Cyanobacteria bacterium UBA9226]
MTQDNLKKKLPKNQLIKCPTGIQGLDKITEGGLPQCRPTLVCGTAGCGKTLLAMEFLIRGVTQYSEPGVFIAFEETAEELTQNVASLGWDLEELIATEKLAIDYIHIEPHDIEETGEYNLDGLFIRLASAIASVKAKRVVLDTIEVLFASLANASIVRSELQRLFRWLKTKGVTAIITGEKGNNTLTRHGLEEYVSDCVICLDRRIQDEISTRRLQILKYRGSAHGSNEYPFLINQNGISILPITSVKLDHQVCTERISTGIKRLDTMLGGEGYFRGSSILITGTAGTGKSSIAAHFAAATCQRGERCLYLAFEEAPQQILRNMRSISLDLEPFVLKGLLQFQATRPTAYSLEMHLVQIHSWIEEFKPTVVIIDPMSNLNMSGNTLQAKGFLFRLIDMLKSQQITLLFTNLTAGGSPLEHTEMGVSSLMDTWLEVRTLESNGERNRVLFILKSRGMEHSHQVREFRLTRQGIELIDVYLGKGSVLTGAARAIQEAKEKAASLKSQQEFERKRRELERKKAIAQSQITALQAQIETEEEELELMRQEEQLQQNAVLQDKIAIAELRKAD